MLEPTPTVGGFGDYLELSCVCSWLESFSVFVWALLTGLFGLEGQFTLAGDWEVEVYQPRADEDFRVNLGPVVAEFIVGDALAFASDSESDHTAAMHPSPNQSPQRNSGLRPTLLHVFLRIHDFPLVESPAPAARSG